MAWIERRVRAFADDASGATSLEFGVISGLIGACLIGVIKTTSALLAAL